MTSFAPDWGAPFWRLVCPEALSGCWLWHGCLSNCGYGEAEAVRLGASGKLAHRIAYQVAIGPIPAGLCVLHKCDVRCCVNPDHLFLGTVADNTADMKAKGRERPPKGERHGCAKLTLDQASEAIRAVAAGESQNSVARRFGVNAKTIWSVVHGHRWAGALAAAPDTAPRKETP